MKQVVTNEQMNQVIEYKKCKFIVNEAYSSTDGVYVKALETKKWIRQGDSQWISKKMLKKALERAGA